MMSDYGDKVGDKVYFIDSKQAPTSVFIELKCGHGDILNQSVPKIGIRYWCRVCENNTIILEVNGVWSWKCTVCRAGRTYGVIRQFADKKATGHAQSRGHDVELWRRGFPETITKIKPQNDVPELPF